MGKSKRVKSNKELERLKQKNTIDYDKKTNKISSLKINNSKNKIKKEVKNKKVVSNNKKNNSIEMTKELKIIKSNNRQLKKEHKKNIRIKKRILVIFLFLLLVAFLFGLGYIVKEKYKEKVRLDNLKKEQELISEISSHYNVYVKTNKESLLYNDKEEVVGNVPVDTELLLKKMSIDKNTKYFEIVNFEGYYIKYEDVEKINNLTSFDKRYKNYIIFNENIITDDKTIFYDENNVKVYEFHTSFNLPIIIKDTDKYGVEFNDRLLYIKSDNVKEIKYFHNTDVNNATGVAVLNYHAFYDENNYDESRNCVTSICHSKSQFKTHLNYIKENNILTLKMNEIEMYIDGKIQLPKSVLITIDVGPKTNHAVDMLTEYEMYATIFLITDWFDEKNYYKTNFIELHSHSHNLHDGGKCPGGQGGAIKCLDREVLLADLRMSREELNGTSVFCYPFYEYNDYSINVLKEAGFTMAFAGYYGNGLVKVGADKFRLPRYVITTGTTISGLDYYFRQIKN